MKKSKTFYIYWFIIVMILVISGWKVLIGFHNNNDNSFAEITNVKIQYGDKVLLLPISEDRLFGVSGPLGTTEISISEGKARILSSPCPEKICVDFGVISLERAAVCLPNHVSVSLE